MGKVGEQLSLSCGIFLLFANMVDLLLERNFCPLSLL
jgi:hypothetical protein